MNRAFQVSLRKRAHRLRLTYFPYGRPLLKTPIQELMVRAVMRPFLAQPIIKRFPAYRQYYTGSRLRQVSKLSEFLGFVSDETVVSFDMFDTLVGRNVEPPHWVLGRSNRFASILLSSAARQVTAHDVAVAREAEVGRLREGLSAAGHDPEIRLMEWLEATCRRLRVSPALAEPWAAYECEAECWHMFALEGAADLLRELKARGKTVVVASDMYLEARHLRTILESCGLSEWIDRIYVSSEYRHGKWTGKLFETILAAESIPKEGLIHIGDNMRSDYLSPSQNGLKAVWLKNKSNLARRRDLLSKALFADLDRTWMAYGATVAALPPLASERRGHEAHDVLYRIGYEILGPSLAVYATATLDAAHRLKAGDIYYLAREGSLFYEMATILQGSCPRYQHLGPVGLRYVFVSRQSATRPSIRHVGPNEIWTTMYRSGHVSILEVLGTFGLDIVAFRPMFEKYLDYAPECLLSPEDPAILRFFRQREVSEEVARQTSAARSLMRRYLAQMNFFVAGEPKVLSDVGWNGTIQGAWAKTFGCEEDFPSLFGFYFGRHISAAARQQMNSRLMPGYILDVLRTNKEELAVNQIIPLFEIAAAASHPTTIGYADINGVVQPVLGAERIAPMKALRDAIRQGVRDYCMQFSASYGRWELDLEALRDHAVRSLARFVLDPTVEEVRAISTLEHEVDWGEARTVVLVSAKLASGQALSSAELEAELERSWWKSGAKLLMGLS